MYFELLVTNEQLSSSVNHPCKHRRLQSCVGTWAKLGYVAFHVQLRKAYFVTTLYTIRTSVHAYAISVYAGDPVSSHPVLVI